MEVPVGEASRQVGCVPGAPCWVSLIARDMTAAQGFYGPLLGWRFEPGPDRWGPHCRAVAGGLAVAGIGEVAQDWEFPVAWTTYFGADSADKVAARVRERGGTVAVGPLTFDAGRLALATDSSGAAFGIWEGRPGPVRALDMLGAPVWIELRTADAFAAAMFYGEVFAWDDLDPDHFEVRWEHEQVVLHVEGRTLAALRGGGTEAAPDPRIRPRWHVYFSVSDTDGAVHQAEALGGRVTTPPHETPYGRVAQLRDREGGLFSVIAHHR
jgi:predicted enzyme related to lactoylglutathione lyase